MLARVVPALERRALARVGSVVGALALTLAVVDDLLLRYREPFGDPNVAWQQTILQCVMLVTALLPFTVSARRAPARLEISSDGICGLGRLAEKAWRREDVQAFSVVRGRRGFSVGVLVGREPSFFELETELDVERMRDALGSTQNQTPEARTALMRAARGQQRTTAVAFEAQAAAALFAILAVASYRANVLLAGKSVAGMLAFAATLVSVVVLRVRARRASPMTLAGMRAFRAHVRLHEGRSPEVMPSASLLVGHERGAQPVARWLASIDAAAVGSEHAYRGSAWTREALWEALRSDASVDEKMIAARVLSRRHGEAPAALVRVVTDPSERLRVAASLESPEDAEAALEELGPLFRAR